LDTTVGHALLAIHVVFAGRFWKRSDRAWQERQLPTAQASTGPLTLKFLNSTRCMRGAWHLRGCKSGLDCPGQMILRTFSQATRRVRSYGRASEDENNASVCRRGTFQAPTASRPVEQWRTRQAAGAHPKIPSFTAMVAMAQWHNGTTRQAATLTTNSGQPPHHPHPLTNRPVRYFLFQGQQIGCSLSETRTPNPRSSSHLVNI
jgi:hypothetical protein